GTAALKRIDSWRLARKRHRVDPRRNYERRAAVPRRVRPAQSAGSDRRLGVGGPTATGERGGAQGRTRAAYATGYAPVSRPLIVDRDFRGTRAGTRSCQCRWPVLPAVTGSALMV